MDSFQKLLFCFCFSLIFTATASIDTINTTQLVRDGDIIASSGGSFELGFFSPGSSQNRYLGIWYGKIPVRTVVWVANREKPLNDSSGVFRLTQQGILVISDWNGSTVWSSNSSRSVRNPVTCLLESGNLIVRDQGDGDDNPEKFLWQSFDYPGDTTLPGMKVGKNLKNGIDWYYSSWTSPDDPSPGHFITRLDLGGFPEFFVRKDLVKQFRLGPWNGVRFTGLPQSGPTPLYTNDFVFNADEVYWIFHVTNSSVPLRVVLNYDGSLRGHEWIDRTQSWLPFQSTHIDDCDKYALCGVYSSCDVNNAPLCGCLEGFMPRAQPEWNAIGWSNGCIRKIPLNCSTDGFQKFSSLKLPETQTSWFNTSMNLQECQRMCKNNCSCTAYTNLNIRDGGSGCLLWFGDLIDLRQLNENGQDIYIRMAASELAHGGNSQRNTKRTLIIVSVSALVTGTLLLGVVVLFCFRRKKQLKGKRTEKSERSSSSKRGQEDLELPLFDLDIIACATNNFSHTNKLGEGGFGPVYKGRLKDGQEIAVKRLSKSSSQGLEEFKNEVMYIAKLQHRNLVKLLGCCNEADKKMLVYEFMPNKSLDSFIFDPTLSEQLNWPSRYRIINGIARGLLYLHQDSRLKIIHRDLKASNVLLDYEMNPKISDFGLARSFGLDESHANTNKVVGTYGYMSPEYAIDGHYSVKSDVYSFGVMVLEIVSGKRNKGFHHPGHNLNLLGHAWKLHEEGGSAEVIASSMRDTCNLYEALRSIHIGLLCMQRSPDNRPSMSTVVFMLGGESALPQPKQPGFFSERDVIEENYSSSSSHKNPFSANQLTITQLEAR